MRDKNHTFIHFKGEIRSFMEKNFHGSLSLKNHVVDSPTFLEELVIIYPRKFDEVEKLVLVHWFLPEALRWRIWLDLVDSNFSHFNRKQKMILKIILSSEEACFRYYYETNRLSSHEFWGKLGQATKVLLPNFLKKYIIVKPKRKRGYDDKGSLRPKDKWLPSHDWTLTLLQNKKEYDDYLLDKTVSRILDYFDEL